MDSNKIQDAAHAQNHCALLSSSRILLRQSLTEDDDDWLNLCWDDFDPIQHGYDHDMQQDCMHPIATNKKVL